RALGLDLACVPAVHMSESARTVIPYYAGPPSSSTDAFVAELAHASGFTVSPVGAHDLPSLGTGASGACVVLFILLSEADAVLEEVSRVAAQTDHVHLTAVGPGDDVRGAILAIQAGVDTYFTADELSALVAHLRTVHAQPPSEREQADHFDGFVTQDPEVQGIIRTAGVIARSAVPVLITGETGVGKEVLARTIHTASGRSGEFVAENVAGLDDALFADALFGHKRGAFTGATGDRDGLVERAYDGTLFLDEIGDLSAASQVKLLRLFESGVYYPVGSDESRCTTARVVLATNHDLLSRVREGAFRLDLFFRLAAFHLQIPPLRRRKGDIPLLAEHFAKATASELGIRPPTFTPGLMQVLESYDYPGNVRELQSIVVTLVSHGRDDRLDDESLRRYAASILRRNSAAELSVPSPVAFPEDLPTIDEVTQQLIDEALRRTSGNQSAAARMLGMTPSAISKRLRRREGLEGL
ncbi:MAG: sigma 54-interacting transcriptional regulator, partial [Spirochaetota bacterium]